MLEVVCWLETFDVSVGTGSVASFWGIVERLCHHSLEVHHDITVKSCFVTQFLDRTGM